MGGFIAIYGIVMITAAGLAGVLAKAKNRYVSGWMAWAFILPPTLLLLVILPRNTKPHRYRPTLDDEDGMY